MTIQLKPCPACGHAATDPTGRTFHACSNHECTLIGPGDDDDGAKWNALPRRNDDVECNAAFARGVSSGWRQAVEMMYTKLGAMEQP